MTSKINWRHAFYEQGGSLPRNQRDRVVAAVMDWSDWEVLTEDNYITRIEDENEDGVWDYEWGNSDFSDYFSERFIRHMDKLFAGKNTVVIGSATKLPLPVASPSPSSKGVVSSSSF